MAYSQAVFFSAFCMLVLYKYKQTGKVETLKLLKESMKTDVDAMEEITNLLHLGEQARQDINTFFKGAAVASLYTSAMAVFQGFD